MYIPIIDVWTKYDERRVYGNGPTQENLTNLTKSVNHENEVKVNYHLPC